MIVTRLLFIEEENSIGKCVIMKYMVFGDRNTKNEVPVA